MAAPTVSTWVPISEIGLNQQIDINSDTKKYDIGKTVTCRDMGTNSRGEAKFRYAGGLDDTAVGEVVVFDGDITLRAVARSKGPVGVAMSACLTGEYGWYQVTGKARVVAGTLSDNKQAYLTATPGSIDETVVTGDHINGMRCTTAADTGYAIVMMNHPAVADIDDSA